MFKRSSGRRPGIGFLSSGDREIGVLRNVKASTRPRLECRRETGLILRCDQKLGKPFQTKQGSRPSYRDQEGRRVEGDQTKWCRKNLVSSPGIQDGLSVIDFAVYKLYSEAEYLIQSHSLFLGHNDN